MSLPSTSTTAAREHPHTGESIADIVLDTKIYSAALRAAEDPRDGNGSQASNSKGDSKLESPHHQHLPSPHISISDLVLNNVTYDAILASSSKNLSLNPDAKGSPVEDARTPPNSPSLTEPPQGFGSLLGASVKVMSGSDGKK